MSQYIPLDIDKIEAARKRRRIGSKIVLFQSTGSTNDIAWEYAANADNNGLCVLAESQHKGCGRRGRRWYSEPGQSILCSVLLTKTDMEAELLTLTAGVAVAEAISQMYKLPCRIKWPNDILIQNKKVAGILIEKQTVNDRNAFVVGIGINCNQKEKAFEQYKLNLPATSLAIEAGEDIDRTELVCVLLGQLEHWLDETNDRIIEQWLQLSGMLGRHVTVECDGRRYSGFCRGIDPVDGLILHLDNSLVRIFAAAQTSIIDF
jgi:BirA family biotin operon repressor/biotin-[acetyl-CoA-carboxylase] ligase